MTNLPYRIIQLQANTPAWLAWRQGGIGASEASVLWGDNKWSSLTELYAKKVHPLEESKANWAQQRGHDLEPVARAYMEDYLGVALEVVSMESIAHPFLRASLDGFNADHGIIVEIKCPGKEDHAIAQSGRIPVYYGHQLQQQMLVAGVSVAYYCSYVEPAQGQPVVLKVSADPAWQAEHLRRSALFWNHVQKQVEPPPYSIWMLPEIERANVLSHIKRYTRSQRLIDKLAAKQKESEKALLDLFPATADLGELQVQHYTRLGQVDYAAVPELKGVDTDFYRKPSSVIHCLKLRSSP